LSFFTGTGLGDVGVVHASSFVPAALIEKDDSLLDFAHAQVSAACLRENGQPSVLDTFSLVTDVLLKGWWWSHEFGRPPPTSALVTFPCRPTSTASGARRNGVATAETVADDEVPVLPDQLLLVPTLNKVDQISSIRTMFVEQPEGGLYCYKKKKVSFFETIVHELRDRGWPDAAWR